MRAKTAGLAALAIVGFAGNSLLCRAALGTGAIDAASFTVVRLASGAVGLAVLARATGAAAAGDETAGGWGGAAALAAYAISFSFAYLRVDAGIGALVLFGSVQATMIGVGLRSGERPRLSEWLGFAVAAAGLAVLVRPSGGSAPDAIGTLLMVVAGVAWGIYSLLGRGQKRALAATAANFARTLPLAVLLGAAAWAGVVSGHVSARGLALAVASGALASGVGYALWYSALPGMTAVRAAMVQLLAPALAAAGGVALLGEAASARLVGGGAAILGGLALAVATRRG